MKRMICNVAILFLLLRIFEIQAASNGAAPTPPMGWSSWMVFKCYTWCSYYDSNPLCYSETNIKQVADAMITGGYSDAGYKYIILDDCWQSATRTWDDRLIADPNRFPNQMRDLALYMHNRGLKFGIFSDLGKVSGQGFPGSYGRLEQDANTFISWDVDYVKMSAASADPALLNYQYPEFGGYLMRSPRSIVYATSWPVYRTYNQYPIDYTSVQRSSNTWRFYGDMDASWQTLRKVMDNYTAQQETLIKVAGPGGWNDPDVLLVGSPGLSYDQCKVQMAIWCIIAAPLIISSDIRTLTNPYKAILQNRVAIGINQDVLGLPGYRIFTKNGVDVWIRKIKPDINGQYSYALAFVNTYEDISVSFSVTLDELTLNSSSGYYMKDVFSSDTSAKGPIMIPASILQMQISPTGVAFYKAELVTSSSTSTRSTDFQVIPEIIRYRY
ncbi:alpha-N-acetylgalactosaminidase-like isoform X2 [Planococcus citri]|uniref:alpha-N-acetylgalactosaminidase-like isoform X2 n=1 Tax=Planococcus citri TaxID=170843 RepID=UPI0031F7ED9A